VPQSIIVVLCLALCVCIATAEQSVLFREEFNDLYNWHPITFPKITEHTTYTVSGVNETSFLRAASKASASAILHKTKINVYDSPIVTWRWKITAVYTNGDAGAKAGDDFPLRIYIMFTYDPANAGLGERIK